MLLLQCYSSISIIVRVTVNLVPNQWLKDVLYVLLLQCYSSVSIIVRLFTLGRHCDCSCAVMMVVALHKIEIRVFLMYDWERIKENTKTGVKSREKAYLIPTLTLDSIGERYKMEVIKTSGVLIKSVCNIFEY